MEIKRFFKSCIIVALAVIGVVALNFNVVQGKPFVQMFFGQTELNTIYGKDNALRPNYSGLTMAGLFEFFALYFLIKANTKIENKRMKIVSLVFAIFLSLFLVFGSSIMLYSTIKVVFDYIIIYTIKFAGLLVITYNLSLAVFDRISNFKKEDIKERVFFTDNIRSFFIVLLILLLAWSPFFLEHFPGALTYDSIVEIHQILGDQKLTNYNPIIHVGFLALSLQIGNLFGTISAGVAVNTILQFLVVGMICSFTIFYLARKKVDVRIRIACLIFFAFFPAIPIMNVVIHKDTIFAALMLLCMIVYNEILFNFKSLYNHKLRVVLAILIIPITALARRNAIYVLYFSFIFFALYVLIKREAYKGYVVKIIATFLVSIILTFSVNKVVSNYTRVPDSWKLYIPAQYNFMIQQLARISIDHKDELNKEELDIINGLYLDEDDTVLEECYSPYLADIAMQHGNSIFFKNHKDEIVSLYFKLVFRYPISFIDSVFCTTSGYWDIEETRYSLWPTMYPNDLKVGSKPILENYYAKFMDNLMNYQNIPLIGLLYSTAFPFWILLGLVAFNFYNKKYNLILLIIPLLLYFATMFIGPLNGEIRYIFCLWMCAPLLIALTFHSMGTKE